MVGNVITFMNLYKDIEAAVKANETSQVYYYGGALCYLMIKIQPVEGGWRRRLAQPKLLPFLENPLDQLNLDPYET